MKMTRVMAAALAGTLLFSVPVFATSPTAKDASNVPVEEVLAKAAGTTVETLQQQVASGDYASVADALYQGNVTEPSGVKEAGEAIMKVTRPAWYYPTIIGGIILIIGAIAAIIALRAKNKKEQDERDKEILNTPLETFGDNETTVKAEDLAKKYDTVYKDNDN